MKVVLYMFFLLFLFGCTSSYLSVVKKDINKIEIHYNFEGEQNISLTHPYDEISTNYDNMGVIYRTQGEYALAIKYLKKSLDIRKKFFSNKSLKLAESYSNLGVLFASIGNYKDALKYLNKALDIHIEVEGKSLQIASIYSTLGSIYDNLEQYPKSLSRHQKSLAIYTELLDEKAKTKGLALAHNGIGVLFGKLKSYDNALLHYNKALAIEKKLFTKETLEQSGFYNNMAMAYMMLKKFKLAKHYLEKSINIKKNILGESTKFLEKEYENLGWLYFNSKNYKKAYVYAKKSMDIFLVKRDSYFSILNSVENEHFIKNSENKINLLFQCADKIGDKKSFQDALTYWLKYKGSVFDNENRIQTLYNQTKDSLIKKKIIKLLRHRRVLAKNYQLKVKSRSETSLDDTIHFHEEQIRSIIQELFLPDTMTSINFNMLVSFLNKDELYIDFAKIEEHYFGFAVTSNKDIYFRKMSIQKSKKIDVLILKFRKDMKKSLRGKEVSSKKKLSTLYELLLKTLLEKMLPNKNSLIISPNGLLSLLPFETLYIKDKQQYLIENKKITYIPSGKEFLRLHQEKEKSIKDEVVIFANPDFDTKINASIRGINSQMATMHFTRLEGTKKEAKIIQKIIGKNKVITYQGVNANEVKFLEIQSPKILHIATHGFFIKGELSNPMLNAGIALSGANNSLKEGRGDGILTALKLSGLNLKGTELVVLSACKTALIGTKSSDSVSVLSKAFIQAGSSNVIASLWSISDNGTKNLMSLFYKELKKNSDYGEALKLAKIKMIKEKISPAIWGAFILNGQGKK